MFHHPSFQPRPVRPGGATGASSQEAFGHSEALSRSTGAAELVSWLSLDGHSYTASLCSIALPRATIYCCTFYVATFLLYRYKRRPVGHST
jgi:hypothetical protein